MAWRVTSAFVADQSCSHRHGVGGERGRGKTAVVITGTIAAMLLVDLAAQAEESRFAMTFSRSQYVHWIELYDATDTKIDPTDPHAPPYSPVFTCGRCHDYAAISRGHHFNALQPQAAAGRPGEPWIWTDTRTGTQLPLSYRGWPGTYDPRALGISTWDFLLKFGRHMPGGLAEAPAEDPSLRATDETAVETTAGDAPVPPGADNGRWPLSGQLAIDCMACHGRATAHSPEAWWDQISKQNFAWAPVAALGIADVDGAVSNLPADFDPAAQREPTPPDAAAAPDEAVPSPDAATTEAAENAPAEPAEPTGPSLPRTRYRALQLSADKKVFFDVVRTPSNNVCYYCHTTRRADAAAGPDWTHDEDVHLRAGMSCASCHRNDLEHHTVRGYEGEQHPSGESVASLSCRGCHLDGTDEAVTQAGGRLGAPKPLHRGLPPIHLETLSCTACHAGPRPSPEALRVQTSMAHALGLPTHSLTAETEPGMVVPVMLQTDGVLYPHRMVWPAFWGQLRDDQLTPLNPDAAQEALRSTLRVRRNATFTETLGKVTLSAEDKATVLGADRASVADAELTDEERAKLARLATTKSAEAFREKLGGALEALQKTLPSDGSQAVYVAGGRAYRRTADGAVETFSHPATQPYAWKLGHDVRPARWSSGATGCYECHALGTPIFDGKVTAIGPAPDPEPPTQRMAELAGYDRLQIDAWNLSFQGRSAFKWFGFVSAGVVGLILVSFLFVGLNGLFGFLRRS